MANADRLTGLDSSFLHLERDSAHMHVAGCMVFDGRAPEYEELVEEIVSRLHLVPRYRQKLAFVPLNQGRPVWVDDPHFNVAFHVRHTALPSPGASSSSSASPAGSSRRHSIAAGRCGSCGSSRASRTTASRCCRRPTTRSSTASRASTSRPCCSTRSPDPMPVSAPDHEWIPRPLPSRVQLLADALLERATVPAEIVRGVRATLRGPRHVVARAGRAVGGVGAMARAGLNVAPSSPFNVKIGPHRRFTWVRGNLQEFKAVKNALGGTVNDVVLAAVAGALGRYLRLHSEPTDDVMLKAMVPVSVRADVERGALGNRVAAMWAPLPVGITDPVQRLLTISAAMDGHQGLRAGGRSPGADRAVGLRAADDHGPGGAAASAPAAVQRRRHERSWAAASAVHARSTSSRRCSRWFRWPRTRRSGSRS